MKPRAEKSRRLDSLILSAPLPPSTNHLYANASSGRRLTQEGRAYKKDVGVRLMLSGARKSCPGPPFCLSMHFRLPDKRRRDLTNLAKALEDAVFGHLGYDDSLVYEMTMTKSIDRSNPGVTVEIRHTDRKLEGAV